MSKKTENLKEYFIVRLLFVMLFILICESLVNLFIAQEVFPVLYNMFGVEFGEEKLSILQNFKIENWFPTSEKLNGWLFLIVLAALLLYVLPYVIGIALYSWIVIKKVEEIRGYDKEQREQYIRKRNLLLSDVAHDLKTPIATISGYAQALNEGMVESPEKQREYLQIIYKKSLQMNQLITVMFDYVKLDSEGFELKKERIDLAEFLREISAEMYSDIEQTEMELLVELPDKECNVMADKAQLARVVINLLTNAIRHNPKGTKIRISLEESCGYKEGWKVQIADTGNRIEEALAEHLFEPFVMGDASRSSRAGSGLGLSIASKIIEMHGGTLSLNQNPEAPYPKVFCIELMKAKETDDYEYGMTK